VIDYLRKFLEKGALDGIGGAFSAMNEHGVFPYPGGKQPFAGRRRAKSESRRADFA
jgi:hypothetical protein